MAALSTEAAERAQLEDAGYDAACVPYVRPPTRRRRRA